MRLWNRLVTVFLRSLARFRALARVGAVLVLFLPQL